MRSAFFFRDWLSRSKRLNEFNSFAWGLRIAHARGQERACANSFAHAHKPRFSEWRHDVKKEREFDLLGELWQAMFVYAWTGQAKAYSENVKWDKLYYSQIHRSNCRRRWLDAQTSNWKLIFRESSLKSEEEQLKRRKVDSSVVVYNASTSLNNWKYVSWLQ